MSPTDPYRAAGRIALVLLLVSTGQAFVRGDDRPTPSTARRAPWTTSRLAGTPDPPPPYTTEPAFPALKFEHPVLLASAPGTSRLFVGEQGGKVYSFPNDPTVARADLVLDLAAHRPGMAALYGLAFHPKFDENRYVYLCYVIKDGQPDGTRVSRFTVGRSDPLQIDPASEAVVLTFPSGGHNGGCLAFGPEGFLYISTGDAEVPSPPDPRDTGQDVSDLLSSILRIDVDRTEAGRAYRVPPDNPFVKLPGARPEIWAYGFRNPWRMSFDRRRGDLWVGDVGWELWELVDRVVKGGNYGWSVVEGRQPVHPDGRRGPTPILPPTAAHPHSEAASITGGYVYRGKRLAELDGEYVYGDFQSGKIWGLRHDGEKVVSIRPLAETPLQLVSFGEDNAGEIYLLDYERTRQIHRLVPNPAAAETTRSFPRKLSETGLFTSTRDQTPAPGVVPYEINATLWSDGAVAERWIALPGSSQVALGPAGEWRLPDGAVLARTVSVGQRDGDSSRRRRVETQILHREAGSWRPYSYVWDDAQSDATLAPAEGVGLNLEWRDSSAPGGRRARAYRVAARAECTLCHNPWVEQKTTVFGRQSASPLGLSTGQLNRPVRAADATVNQLHAFAELGLFSRPPGPDPDKLPRTADPYDSKADLNRRARAYLQVNCAHCHQANAGGTATILLSEDVPPHQMNAIDVKPSQGAFGITDARIIRPGDPEGSTLFYRVAKLGGGRMPRVGSTVVDERGVALLGDWIRRMPGAAAVNRSSDDQAALLALRSAQTDPAARTAAVARLLASTRGALALMQEVERRTVDGPARREAVRLGASHPSGEVRDLFERFVPESERVARLGDSFEPKVVLDLKGDARRGRDVFMNNPAAQCKSCHRLDGAGEPVGPDLSKVGAKYARAEMLAHILEPSRTIDPQFTTYAVETKEGQVHTGLLASKTATEVVLKDAANKETRIPADRVEQMIPQPRSLMPELLLRDLTAAQAADLLEYLGSLK